jgi:hypothetical protein
VNFYGGPYLQKMMDLDCWTIIATAIKENTQDTPIHQKVVISIARFIEASHQLFKRGKHHTIQYNTIQYNTIQIIGRFLQDVTILWFIRSSPIKGRSKNGYHNKVKYCQ